MYRKTLFVLLLLFSAGIAQAQEGRACIDSLRKEAQTSKEDTNKVNLLRTLSVGYSTTNADSGILYGEQALELAEHLGWKQGIANADHALGINYRLASDYSKALECYFKALQINEESGNKINMAGNMCNIGVVYATLHNYPKALDYYLKALKIFEKTGPDNKIASVFQNIGNIYSYTGDYSKALEYTSKALAITEKTGNKNGVALNLGNIGNIYYMCKNYSKALEYDFKALKTCEEVNDKRIYAITLGNIGEAWLAVAKGSSGNGSLPAGQAGPDKIYGITGKTGALHEAIGYLDSGVTVCKKLGYTDDEMEFAQYLSEAYELSGNYKGAYENNRLYASLKDTLFSAQKNMKIASLEQAREKELQARIDGQRNKFLLIAGLLLAAISILVLNRRMLKTRKNREITAAKERLLHSEKLRMEEDLHNAQKQLEQYLKSINEKNELIEQFYSKVNSIPQEPGKDDEDKYVYIQQLADSTLLTDTDWAEFKTLFVKVHNGFFIRLYEKYPALTEAEIRILALAKLNISTKQMAGMLGISPSSVITARYRLRKKMDLHEEHSLESI